MLKLSAIITCATLALLDMVQGRLAFGFCDKPALETNFDINRYLGPWHEYVRDKSILFEYGECVQAKYSMKSNGRIELLNSQYYKGRIYEVKDSAKCKGAQCKVGFFPTGDYRVLDTDYETFAVVYSCDPYIFFKDENVWILTRARTPDASVITTAENIIKAKLPKYTFDNFKKTQHGGTCKYLHDEYVAPI